MMSRVDETSPPGVSSRITSAEPFSCLAFWIACEICRVVATPMTPFTSVMKTLFGDCALADCGIAAAIDSSTKPANDVSQTRHVKHAAIGPSDEPSDGNASAAAHAFGSAQYRWAVAARERPRLQVSGPGAALVARMERHSASKTRVNALTARNPGTVTRIAQSPR